MSGSFLGIGGQALAALSSIGYGQTWQNVTASRVAGTNYTNTTGRPITVAVNGVAPATAGNKSLYLAVNGSTINASSQYLAGTAGSPELSTLAIIPPLSFYSFSVNGVNLSSVFELK